MEVHDSPPSVPQLALSLIRETHDGAGDLLARGADFLRRIGQANVFCRILLGRQLLVIQQHQLWTNMERSEAAPGGVAAAKYRSWGEFMKVGFPQITGLSPETGYAAFMLAKTEFLRNLPESELRKFGSLENAIHLVRLQRQGVSITPELIAAAQTRTAKDFRQLTGYGKKAVVEAVVESQEAARELQRILAILKMADAGALAALREVLEHAMLLGGDNGTDAVDAVIAACVEQWRQEQEPAEALAVMSASQREECANAERASG